MLELHVPLSLVPRLPNSPEDLATMVGITNLPDLLAVFVHDQLNPLNPIEGGEFAPQEFYIDTPIAVFPSAVATFFAPSDNSGMGGMRRERIRATRSWRRGAYRFDCVFAQKDSNLRGMMGLHAARVRLFMSFTFEGRRFPCALVEWFSLVGETPDDETGMWVVEPDFNDDGSRFCGIIHTDTIVRGAHLIPVYGSDFLPPSITYSNSLSAFRGYFVNKYADYHAHTIAF